MKYVRNYASALCAALLLSFASGANADEKAAAFRRFNTRDGKTFYAVITAKSGSSVTFKLQNGKPLVQAISGLSEPDQQFVRKWTKFKDDLLSNAEFATLTVKEMLELRGYQSFEFDIHGNHIFVDGEVAGKPMRFMIDTGAYSSIIHDKSAKEAGLEIGPYDQEIRGVAGTQKAAVTKITVLKLGDALIENRKLLATDFIPIGGGPGEFDVIFGADFLRELDAVISYREGRMFLKTDNIAKAPDKKTDGAKAEFRRWTSADGTKNFVAGLVDKTEKDATFRLQDGKTTVVPLEKLSEADQEMVKKWSKLRDDLAKNPEWRTLTVKELLELRAYQSFQYRLEGNHILVDGLVGETKARFLIDTGAHSCTMDLKYAKDIAKLEVGPMDQVIRGIGGEAPAAITKVPLIKLGDAIIRDRIALSAEIHKGSVGGEGNHDALFGAEFLRELDAVINYKEGRMFLKPDNSDKPSEDAPKKDAPKKDEPKKEEPKKDK
ncbi:MAG TPA: aspartyl protease family protein [Verrucomicrobiales bacterium]|nr:aspartyl protease family protein [Verrucomicrobiales bacterium]